MFFNEKLSVTAFFIPPAEVATVYDLLWIVGINDFLLKETRQLKIFFSSILIGRDEGCEPPYWRGEGMCDPFLIRIYTPTHKLSFTLEFRRWGEGGGGVVTPFLATMFSFNWLPFQVPLCVLQDLGDRVPSQAGAVPGITFIYQTNLHNKQGRSSSIGAKM